LTNCELLFWEAVFGWKFEGLDYFSDPLHEFGVWFPIEVLLPMVVEGVHPNDFVIQCLMFRLGRVHEKFVDCLNNCIQGRCLGLNHVDEVFLLFGVEVPDSRLEASTIGSGLLILDDLEDSATNIANHWIGTVLGLTKGGQSICL
jgi:hypothetical protein